MTSDGTAIAVESSGQSPPLVLIRGGSADHHNWDVVASSLAERSTTHRVGHRGRNESDRSDDLARGVSATLREETDLDALSNELASVVCNTMQPELVSLWLREPGGFLAHPRPGRGSPVE